MFMPLIAIGQYQPLNLNFEKSKKTIIEGLEYTHFQSDTTGGSALSIHLLQVDLNQIILRQVLAMDQVLGQETTSHMTLRHGALAGINGGFSFSNNPWNVYHGDPRDFFMLDGKILSEPHKTRSSFGIYYDTVRHRSVPFFDQVQWEGFLIAGSDTIEIDGINRVREEDEIVKYTPAWGRSSLTKHSTSELIVADGIIEMVSSDGSSIIPENGYVVAIPDYLKEKFEKSQPIAVVDELFSLLFPEKKPRTANTSYNTAGPLLIWDGKIIDDYSHEQIPVSFDTTRHPRTAVGISEDGTQLMLMVVDGRQPQLSLGMSLKEVAHFLEKQGAHSAYNLDGGGSSTMVIHNEIVNSPSDPQERRRCDAVLLFPRE